LLQIQDTHEIHDQDSELEKVQTDEITQIFLVNTTIMAFII